MARLVNVKLDLRLPGIGGIEGTWEPDETEIRAAWELYVEMVTRTPLGSISLQEGSARETLTSIYSLFETTRGVLRNYGPGVARPKKGKDLSLGYLAVSMLNLVLRQLLTDWHPRLRAWELKNPGLHEDEWADRCDFRKALHGTRDQLRQYASLFAQVAGVPELVGRVDVTTSTP